jgi:TatD DNase family protein
VNNLPSLIDTHAHLDDDRFSSDLGAVLQRASESGIQRILTIGIDLSTSRSAIELASKYPLLSAVVGIQPNHVAEASPTDWDEIVALSKHSTVVAIGETGLDRYWDRAPFDLQEEYFARHLELCRSCNLPVVIHCREAEADIVRTLRREYDRHGAIRGVMHSFTGDAPTASACLEMGLHISFAGMVTFKNNPTLREVAKAIPLDRILVETDSPYLSPMPHRGRRNEPSYVRHTAKCLAEVMDMTFEQFAIQTTENAKKLFRL